MKIIYKDLIIFPCYKNLGNKAFLLEIQMKNYVRDKVYLKSFEGILLINDKYSWEVYNRIVGDMNE